MPAAAPRMRTEVKAHLDVWDFECSHEDVSAALNLQPSRIWLPGDRIGPTTRTHANVGWRYDSNLPAHATASEHIANILAQLEGRASFIRSIQPLEAWIVCVLHVHEGDRPDLVIELDLIRKLASLNIALDIDLYNFP